jgi:hypothetical protein
MSADPLPIVEEFLQSRDPQLRKNAITALALIASNESIEQLVRVALTDRDDAVRARCEDELVELQSNRTAAFQLLRAALDNKATRMAAYALLGRLRSRGAAVDALPFVPFSLRLRLAFSLREQICPTWSRDFWLRTLAPATVGGIIGLAFFLLAWISTRGSFPDFPVFASLVVSVLILSMFLAATTSYFMSPFGLQLYRRAATIVDLVSAFCLAYIGIFVSLLVVEFFVKLPFASEVYRELFLIVPLYIAAIRLGTLLAFNIFGTLSDFNVSFDPRQCNRVAQVVAGVATGVVACVVPVVLSRTDVNALGISMMLAGVGVASAFASIDAQAPPFALLEGRNRWRIRVAIVVVVVLCAVAMLAASIDMIRSHPEYVRWPSGSSV